MEILFILVCISTIMASLYYIIVNAVRRGIIQAYYYIEADSTTDKKNV